MTAISSKSIRLQPISSNTNAATAVRYALAVLAAIGALLLRDFLNPFFGQSNFYHTAWLAVVFSAWYCGLGPSIVAVIIDALGIWHWFLPPVHSFTGKGTPEISGLLGFLVFSAVIITFGESTRRHIAKKEKAEEELRQTREELEQRVQERTAALEQRTAEVVEKATLLDLANDAIFIKAANDEISYWNQGAERLYGWTASEALGQNPAQLLQTSYPIPLEEIQKHEVWEGELAHTTRDGRRIVVASRWTMLRNDSGEPVGWMEINTDITDRKRAENAARSLSGRILTLQDDERRRIARGLHDSLGQYLAALKMQIGLLSASNSSEDQVVLLAQASDIIDRCITETRTVSHLLHPPLLDEAGFGSAARWFVEGFAQRSGIAVDLSLPPDLGRLHSDLEITLFRTLQEALTNVHRHSASPKADIRVTVDQREVRLQIQDYGQGIPPGVLRQLLQGAGKTGVGVAGMRERVRELGGYLTINSDSQGTLLTVVLPISSPSNALPVESASARKISVA